MGRARAGGAVRRPRPWRNSRNTANVHVVGNGDPASIARESEIPLHDTSNRRVVRVGRTVRRPVYPWSPAIHALLKHLEAVRFPFSPRFLGIDDQGREWTIAAVVDPSTNKEYVQAQRWDGLEWVGSKQWVARKSDAGETYVG